MRQAHEEKPPGEISSFRESCVELNWGMYVWEYSNTKATDIILFPRM